MRSKVWNKITNPALEAQIVQLYREGYSAPKILKRLNYIFKTTKSIYDILKKYNVDIKRGVSDYKQLNDYIFEIIDSERKAYWLGFLLTDGWVQKHHNKTNYEVGIQLQERDKEHLNDLKDLLGTTNQIFAVYKKKDNKKFVYYRLVVVSNKLAEDLRKYGMVENKSSIMRIVPNYIPKNYFCHFLRGIFDGNGSVHIDKNDCCRMKFYGTYDVTFFINVFLWCEINVSYRNISISSNVNMPVYQLEYASREDLVKLYNYMFKNATIYLPRKKEVLECYLQQRSLI